MLNYEWKREGRTRGCWQRPVRGARPALQCMFCTACVKRRVSSRVRPPARTPLCALSACTRRAQPGGTSPGVAHNHYP